MDLPLFDSLAEDPSGPLSQLAARDPLARDVLAALALGALARSRTWVCELLATPAVRTPGSAAPSMEALRLRLALLQKAGLANEDERRAGSWTLPMNVYPQAYADLLRRVPAEALQSALAHADCRPRPCSRRSRMPTATRRWPSAARATAASPP